MMHGTPLGAEADLTLSASRTSSRLGVLKSNSTLDDGR